MSTARDQMVELLDELKIAKAKADRIVELFEQLLGDVSSPSMVHVAGARPAIEVVEVYGLSIGLDACGNASTVEPIGVGLPQGLDVGELEYS